MCPGGPDRVDRTTVRRARPNGADGADNRWASPGGPKLLPLVLTLVVLVGASCSSPASSTSATVPVRPTAAVATACATNHPDRWMGCITTADPGFSTTALSRTAIPGAHDSGTFTLEPTAFDTQANSDCTNYSPAFASVPSLVTRWSQTQSLDLTQQLDAGIRYLDLRIAYTGDPTTGWRIVHTQFSSDPLATDLGAIASWARAHPTEVVLADVQHLCYDNAPDRSAELALWEDFAALGPVSYDPVAGAPVGRATLGGIAHQGGGGHNVVVLLPGSVRRTGDLLHRYGVHASFVTAPGAQPARRGPSPTVPEAYAWASTVSPSSPSAYDAANAALATFPLAYSPPLGSLMGTGIYQAQLIYSLNSSDLQRELATFQTFGGLIPVGAGSSGQSGNPAWELGLWAVPSGRDRIVAGWGHRLNVVVSDGIQYGGFVPAVVAQNAA